MYLVNDPMTLPKPGDLVLQLPARTRPAGLGRHAGRPGRVPGFFLKGPVPLAWLASAATLRGRALAVGILVWFMAGMKRESVVTVPRARLAEFGLDRFAFSRGLASLERHGLVEVDRRRGAKPRITLVVDGRDHHSNGDPAIADLERK
jgi:hypothetical protein